MTLGFLLGELFDRPAFERRPILFGLGVASVLGFVMLRWLNGYGDPSPWSGGQGRGLLAFLNTTKYPPSLAYLLMTLGPGLIALAWLEDRRGPVVRGLLTYGRVPLFFYVSHIYLVHGLALVAFGVLGLEISQGARLFIDYPKGYGFGLATVYLLWIGVVAALYPFSQWFGELKRRGRAWWWSYL